MYQEFWAGSDEAELNNQLLCLARSDVPGRRSQLIHMTQIR